MEGRGAVLGEGEFVCGRGITFVLVEAIERIEVVHGVHDLIAQDFGDDGGGGDVLAELIAFDDGFAGEGVGKGIFAVD